MIYALSAAASPPSLPVDECGPGRNAGRPQPKWWTAKIRPLIEAERDAFPPWIDTAFLGAWIEHESDGRESVTTSLGEVGYFQLHPAEIEDIAGKDAVDAVIAQIQGSRKANVRWGGRLLKHYDEAVIRFGITRGTPLYHALLKVMHSSRPRGIRWLQHVVAVLGRPPHTYDEFIQVVYGLADGTIPSRIDKSLPARKPSCAARYLLRRREVFLLPDEDPRYPTGRLGGVAAAFWSAQQAYSASAQALLTTLSGAWPDFVAPVPWRFAWVSSGWGDDRSYRGGTHEGMDFPAPAGTPVYAVADGVVKGVTTGTHAGLFVTVQHAAGWATRYMHLSAAAVKKGQHVEAGDRIGSVGASGTSRSGPHLHFDVSLAPSQLAAYASRFGQPTGGFGTKRSIGVAVPAEPLTPVRGYAKHIHKYAKARGVALYVAPRIPWHKVFVGLGAVTFVGLVGLDLYRRRA